MTAPKTLAEALALLQGQLPRVAKEHRASVTSQRTGKTHSYDYADLADVSAALLPLLSALGLSFTSCPTLVDGKFALEYSLRCAGDNETVGGLYPLPGTGSPQEIGTAITYARRYALCAVTGLAPGGDDDDAQAAEDAHRKAARAPERTARPKPPAERPKRAGAAHERLVHDDMGHDPRKAERVKPTEPDPDNDPWAQDAPVDHDRAARLREAPNGRDLTDPEDKPGSILPAQHRAIERVLGLLGIDSDDRDKRHDQVGVILGVDPERTFGSMKNLSYSQAAIVLTELNRIWSDQAKKVRDNA